MLFILQENPSFCRSMWNEEGNQVKVLQTLIGFIFIGFMLYIGYQLVMWTIYNIDPQIAAAIFTGAFTIFLSAISLIISRNYESKQKIKEANRLKKVPIYDDFLKFMLEIMGSQKVISEKEAKKFAGDFNHQLLIWGSSEVVKTYGKWRLKTIELSEDKSNSNRGLESFQEFENLIIAIRKDLGHKDKEIEKNVFLRVFINDIDNKSS